jgi:hypothetical protein
MRVRTWGLVVAWAMSLIAVGAWAQASKTIVEGPGLQPPQRIILAGDNIGFQASFPVQQRPGNGAKYVRGALMVRINGEWIYAEVATGMYPWKLEAPRP